MNNEVSDALKAAIYTRAYEFAENFLSQVLCGCKESADKLNEEACANHWCFVNQVFEDWLDNKTSLFEDEETKKQIKDY